MKFSFKLTSIILLACIFFASCAQTEISEILAEDDKPQTRRISFYDETNLRVEGISTTYSDYPVLSFDTWDDVYKLLEHWDEIDALSLRDECNLLGFHNVIVESNIVYDSLYYTALDALGLVEDDLYDDEFELNEVIFDEIFASSLYYNMEYLALNRRWINGDSAEVVEPIGELDMFALCNPDGYLIIEDVLYKQVEDVIISSYDEYDNPLIINIETMQDLADLWENNSNNEICMNWYRSSPTSSSLSLEDYWYFIWGYMNQNHVWFNLTETWITQEESNNIGKYYSTISFEGGLHIPRFSSQNPYYDSSLTIINYRKKNNQTRWHRCKLPTSLHACIGTMVSYQQGFLTEETEYFDATFDVEKKFYRRKLRWRSNQLDDHVELSSLTNHEITSVHIDFTNDRTYLYL